MIQLKTSWKNFRGAQVVIAGTYLRMEKIIRYGLASLLPTGGKLGNLMWQATTSAEDIY